MTWEANIANRAEGTLLLVYYGDVKLSEALRGSILLKDQDELDFWADLLNKANIKHDIPPDTRVNRKVRPAQ